MKAAISIFRMFVLVCGTTYVEVHFNHSKFINFINSWKMVKNTKKLDSRFFSKKTLKKLKRKPGWNILYIRGYGVTYPEFSNFKLWSKPHKSLWEALYQQKHAIKTRVKFWPHVPFKPKGQLKRFVQKLFSTGGRWSELPKHPV